MTIFFDTNILIKYIFNQEPIKELFELSKIGKITIYISEIVLWEYEKHFIINVNDKIVDYNETLENLSKLIPNENKKLDYDKIAITKIFNAEKCELIKDYKIKIAKFYHEDIIDSIKNRYLESKAPFHNKGDNLKDYIIWESYREIINKNKEEEYIFISDNINDFSNNKSNIPNDEGLYEGHYDFYKDINIKKENLKFYRKINGFIRGNKEYQKIYKMYLFEKFGLDRTNISVLKELFKFMNNTLQIININTDYSIEILDNGNIFDKGGNCIEVDVKVIPADTSNNGKIKKIETKCTFTVDAQNLIFRIDSITDLVK